MKAARGTATILVSCLLFACAESPDELGAPAEPAGNQEVFLVGAGVYDITGPAAGVGMMGYSLPEQQTAGIHMRLRSRAFVVAEPGSGKRVVIVIADLCQCFQAVKQEVVRRLAADPELGPLYHDRNLLISATHTHSGPGGYSHYDLYNLSVLGFVEQNFGAIASGIFESIRRAHHNLAPGRILINEGEVADCGWNASAAAYEQNPAAERARYDGDTDRTMTLLRFESGDGGELGSLNWYPVHPTNLGNTIRLISGDNKGLAAWLFEREKGAYYKSASSFVAAFAQSQAGDISPSLFWGYPDGVHDFERLEIMARRQYTRASELYREARTPLRGSVDYRHTYVDFSRVTVNPEWIQDGEEPVRTCTAAIGLSMLAGSTEDAVGLPFIPEGITCGGAPLPCIPLVPEEQPCHQEKYVVLSLGGREPVPWTPEVLPVQILQIGNLAVIGQPTEISTMSARRLRETVLRDLGAAGVEFAVIAGLSNAYAGYVTTREEYASQQYEGASNHFGPYSLNAFQQTFSELALALARGEAVPAGPSPRDLRGRQQEAPFTSVLFDAAPAGVSFGDVASQPRPAYARGETATVVFWGGDPRNDLRTQDSFLYVQRKEDPADTAALAAGASGPAAGASGPAAFSAGPAAFSAGPAAGASGPAAFSAGPAAGSAGAAAGSAAARGAGWVTVALDGDPETRLHWQRQGLAGSRITIEWTIPPDAAAGEYRIRHAGSWKDLATGRLNPYEGVSSTFAVQ